MNNFGENHEWCMRNDKLYREAYREYQLSIIPPAPIPRKIIMAAKEIVYKQKGTLDYINIKPVITGRLRSSLKFKEIEEDQRLEFDKINI